MYHETFLSWFSRFLCPPSTQCYNSYTRFSKLVKPLFLFVDAFCIVPVTSQWNILTHTQSFLVSRMRVIASLVFLIFSLYVEVYMYKVTMTSLHLLPRLYSPTKNPKLWSPNLLKK